MNADERQLLGILQERSFRRGDFILASGEPSRFYIDVRKSAVSSGGAHLIGEVLYGRTKDSDIDALGGMQVGAVPLTTAAVISYHRHGRPMEGFWVREEVKSHGTRKRVEGAIEAGMRVGIVDDVSTSGGSTLKAIEAVRDYGCEVAFVLALVDRLQGAGALFREHGIEDYRTIFTIRDFAPEFAP